MIRLHVTVSDSGILGGVFSCTDEQGKPLELGEVANEDREIELTFSHEDKPRDLFKSRVFADKYAAGYLAIILKDWCSLAGGDL